jgi:hypothetical protein
MRILTFIFGAAIGGGAAYLAMGGWKKLAMKAAGLGDAGDVSAHMRQIRRYAFAASQDKSPVVGLTHASYSLVLLDTLEEVVGREALVASGIDPRKLRSFIAAQQDRHAAALQSADPYMKAILELEAREGRTGSMRDLAGQGWGPAPMGA